MDDGAWSTAQVMGRISGGSLTWFLPSGSVVNPGILADLSEQIFRLD